MLTRLQVDKAAVHLEVSWLRCLNELNVIIKVDHYLRSIVLQLKLHIVG